MTFSVILPVYNVRPYLGPCLDSLVKAVDVASRRGADCHVELLCVDDGSTDGSERVLDDYASTVGASPVLTLTVIHQPNGGVSAARNHGLSRASGDWLLFVDSDDVVRETIFADLEDLHARYPNESLLGFGLAPLETETPQPHWRRPAIGLEEVQEYKIDRHLPDHFAMLGAYRFAYRRSRFGDIRFPSYTRGEDLVYVARVLARADSHVYLKREEYGYRNRPASAVHAEMTPSVVREAVRFHAEMFRVLSAAGKTLGDRAWHLRLEQWILRLPIVMSGRGSDRDWCDAWTEWRASLSTALALPYVSGGCRFVARVGTICPLRPLVACLCRLEIRREKLLKRFQ